MNQFFSITRFKKSLKFILVLLLMNCSIQSFATHFRYGSISWKPDLSYTGAPNTYKIDFTVTESWRWGFPWNGYAASNVLNPPVGAVIDFGGNFPFQFGDGQSDNILLTVTSVSSADDWLIGEYHVSHIYTGTAPRVAFFEGAARLSFTSSSVGLQNNGDGSFRVETGVSFTNGDFAPVSTLQPILNIPNVQVSNIYQIFAFDPDNDPITFSLAPPASFTQAGVTPLNTQPVGLTITPDGLLSFPTLGKVVGTFYNAIIRVADNKGAYIDLDFLIKITAPSNPPNFDYTTGQTPANNSVFHILTGQNISFNVKAKDPDLTDNTSLLGNGIPIGATTTPALPTAGAVNAPVTSVFSWTPTTSQVGTYVVSFIAQDPQGVQRSTSVTIIVCTPPTATCKTAVIHLNSVGTATLSPSDINNGSFSVCGAVTLSISGSGVYTCNDIGQHTVTLTVTDPNNNIATCDATVTVVDDLPPVWSNTPGSLDATVECDDAGALAAAQSAAPTATDNCTANLAYVKNTGPFVAGATCPQSGTYTNTFTVTDANGNNSKFIQVITVQDTHAPVLTGTLPGGSNITACIGAAPAAPAVADISSQYTDNCGGVNVSLVSSNVTGTNCSWTATYTYSVADACGNAASNAVVIYTGGDHEPPHATGSIPAGGTGLNICFPNIPAGPSEADIAALYADNCGGVHVVKTGTPTGSSASWTVTYHYTITDDCNNAATPVDITYSGADTEPPVINCASDVTVTLNPGECNAVLHITSPTVSDNCDVLTLGNALNFDGIDDIALVPASSTINQSHAQRTVEVWFRVNDKNINSRKQVIWEEGGPQNGLNIYVYDGKLYCGAYSMANGWNGTWFSTSAINSGQWHNAAIVLDASLPTNQLTVYLDGVQFGQGFGTTLANHPDADAVGAMDEFAVFHDGVVTNISRGNYFGGDIDEIRCWTTARTTAELAANLHNQLTGTEAGLAVYYNFDQGTACGNNTGVTTLVDVSGHLNGSMQNFALNGGCTSNWTTGAPVLNSTITLTNNYTNTADAGGTYSVGTTNVVWTATDVSGNHSTCTQKITVIDSNPPQWITAAGDLDRTVECSDAGGLSDAQTLAPVASDNCNGHITYTKTTGAFVAGSGCPQRGTYNNAWTAVNDHGNSTTTVFQQVITITDTQAPHATGAVPSGATNLNLCYSSIPAGPSAADISALYADNCGAVHVVKSGSPTGNSSSWSVTYHYVITDDCNNAAAPVDITYSGSDHEPPVITCAQNITVNNTIGQCGARVCYTLPTVTDNCTPVTPAGYNFLTQFGNSYYYQSNALSDFATANNNAHAAGGHLAVITTAAENNAIASAGGNFAWIGGGDEITEGTFQWDDCEPFSYTHFCGGEPNGGTGENRLEFEGGGCWNDLGASAGRYAILEIEGAKMVQTAGLMPNSVFPVGTTTNTFVATDGSGNSSTCSFTVTVNDTELPVLHGVPGPVTVQCDAVPVPANVTATDNCPGVSVVSFNETRTNGSCPNSYTLTRTWSATDAHNNVQTASQTVTVIDNTKPTFTRPADITLYKDGNCNVDDSPAGAAGDVTDEHDNCATGLNATFTDAVAQNCEGSYTITRTWHLVDLCGNAATDQVQTIMVKDNIVPTFTRPADITIFTDANCSYNASVAATGDVTNEHDNCSTNLQATFTDVTSNGSCEGSHTIIRTWHLVDHCNNAAADQVQMITVSDHTAPTFTRPADVVVPYTSSCDFSTATIITGTPTNIHDNCSTGLVATSTDAVSQCGYNTVITRTWHLVDHCGNAAPDQVQTITATDNNTPYIIYAADEVHFGESNYINGDVGVTSIKGKAEFKKNDILDPFTVRASDIHTDPNSSVNHKVLSPATGGPNPTFYPFTGDTHGLPDYTVSVSTAVPISANYKNLNIKKGVTCTVTGTLYSHINMEEGTQVTFAPVGGVLNVEEFDAKGNKDNPTTKQIFTGCTSVRIANHVDLGDNDWFNVGGPKVTVNCGDNNKDGEDFHVHGKNSIVTANIYIPIGDLHVDGSDDNSTTVMNGWYIVQKLHSDGKNVTWNKYGCIPTTTTPFAANKQPVTDDAAIATPAAKQPFDVSAYPNPARTDFNLQITGMDQSKPVLVRITDVSGKVVLTKTSVAAKGSVISIGAGLRAGSYFAEISQGNNRKIIKLVKLD